MTELSLAVATATSALVYVAGRRRLGLSLTHFVPAVTRALECVGLALVFFVANTAVAAVVVLGLRVASGRFVSLYIAAGVSTAALALFQAIVFQAWRAIARTSPG